MEKQKIGISVFVEDKRNGGASWVGIGYIKSYLSHKYDVVVNYYSFNEIDNAVNEFIENPLKIIGMPILQRNMNTALEYAEEIKKVFQDTIIIVGNIVPTLYAEEFLYRYPQIDISILGEGEVTMLELCDRLFTNTSLSECQGIVYRNKEGEIIVNKRRSLIKDISALPFPDRSIYINKPTAYGVLGSRGCMGNCTFCDSRTILGNNVRTRTISNIIDEVEHLIDKYNCNYIGFYDSTFCANADNAYERLNELYETLLNRNLNINFQLNVRAEQLDDNFCDKLIDLTKIGLNDILIGLEAGNDADLKLYGKPARKRDNINAIKVMREKGLLDPEKSMFLEYGFINFNPYSTKETLLENIAFLRDSGLFVDFSVLSSHLALYGGASICRKVKNDGLLNKDQVPIITDPLAYQYLYDETEQIFDLIEFCHRNYSDGIMKNIELHYNIYKTHLKNAEGIKNNYIEYVNYRKKLTDFSLDIATAIIADFPNFSKEKIRKELDKFAVSHKQQINSLTHFQQRLTMDLLKNNRLVIY